MSNREMDATASGGAAAPKTFTTMKAKADRTFRIYMDKIVPFTAPRWGVFGVLCLLFLLRIILAEGYYVICYGVFIHLLYLTVLVITPRADMEEKLDAHIPEHQREKAVFVPKVGEFTVWKQMMRVVLIGFVLSFIPFLDLPVYVPVLVLYFFALVGIQVGTRVQHMIKYKYVPWNTKKKPVVRKEGR